MADRTYLPSDLRAWRARVRLSQADLAQRFGVSQRAVSQWEAGHLPSDFAPRFEAVVMAFYAERPELLETKT